MKEDRITQKWRLIKLSKRRPLLAFRITNALSEKFSEEVYRIAFDYGKEKGEEVARNLRLRGFGEVGKFLSMITGVNIEHKDEEILFLACPVNSLEHIKSEKVCKGFIEGFFSTFGIKVDALPYCGNICKILVKKIRP